MIRAIIHPGTGTIIDADECVLLDSTTLAPEQQAIFRDGDEDAFIDLACTYGEYLRPYSKDTQ